MQQLHFQVTTHLLFQVHYLKQSKYSLKHHQNYFSIFNVVMRFYLIHLLKISNINTFVRITVSSQLLLRKSPVIVIPFASPINTTIVPET